MINISSNQFGHSETYFFFFFSLGISFPLPTEIEEERNKKLKSTSFTHFFSFRSLFLDQKPTTKLTWVLPTTSLCYIWYFPLIINHKELGIALYFVVQRNMYLCLMERCVILSYLIIFLFTKRNFILQGKSNLKSFYIPAHIYHLITLTASVSQQIRTVIKNVSQSLFPNQ